VSTLDLVPASTRTGDSGPCLDAREREAAPVAARLRGPLAQLRCVDCGYGVSAQIPPERCPMCSGSVWEHERWRPFTSLEAPVRENRLTRSLSSPTRERQESGSLHDGTVFGL
jgi:hypothetical protein